MAEEGAGPTTVSFAELEAQLATPKAADLGSIVLDDVGHEELKGKSVKDFVAFYGEMKRGMEAAKTTIQTLSASQSAMQAAMQQAPAPQQVVATPQVEAERTDADWKKLYEEDPFAYQQARMDLLEKRTLKAIDARVSPLTGGVASTAEAEARRKYAEEFEVLGPEIAQVLDRVPDKAALAAPGAWDQVVRYVRGEHQEKMFDHRQKKSSEAALAAARAREAGGAGVSFAGGGRSNGVATTVTNPGGLGELSPEQKDVCRVMHLSEQEYRQYYM